MSRMQKHEHFWRGACFSWRQILSLNGRFLKSVCRISFRTYGCKRKLGWEAHRVGRLRSHVREMKTCGHSSEGGTTMRASLPRQDADETGTPPSGVGWTVCIALLVLLGAGLLTRITDDAGVPISCCPRYPRLAYKMMQQSGRRAVLDGSSS